MKRIIALSFVCLFILLAINIIGINVNDNPLDIKITSELQAARVGEWVYIVPPWDCYKCYRGGNGCAVDVLPEGTYGCWF